MKYFDEQAAEDISVANRVPLVHAMLQVCVSLVRFSVISTSAELYKISKVRMTEYLSVLQRLAQLVGVGRSG